MKVIDLLNKIANGEVVPAKIKVYNDIYEFDTFNKLYWNNKHKSLLEFYNGYILTYKVEIIEDTPKEDKKIEYFDDYKIDVRYFDELVKSINLYIELNKNKINEIIDKISGE